MSLRDFAAHCLRRVAPALSLQHSHDEDTVKFILDTTVLSLIRNAIRIDGSELLHSESVLLLGAMVIFILAFHPVLFFYYLIIFFIHKYFFRPESVATYILF